MAKVYKQLSLGVSSKPITVMLERSNAAHPFSEATGIHDSGCGPGSVISQIISDYGNSLPMDCTLSASDFSPAMVEQVEKTRKSELEADSGSIWARLEPAIQDAMDLQLIGDGSKR
jgi:trans-aconitate methyltransferase